MPRLSLHVHAIIVSYELGDKTMSLIPGFAVSIREIVCEEGVFLAVTTVWVAAGVQMEEMCREVSLFQRVVCTGFNGVGT